MVICPFFEKIFYFHSVQEQVAKWYVISLPCISHEKEEKNMHWYTGICLCTYLLYIFTSAYIHIFTFVLEPDVLLHFSMCEYMNIGKEVIYIQYIYHAQGKQDTVLSVCCYVKSNSRKLSPPVLCLLQHSSVRSRCPQFYMMWRCGIFILSGTGRIQ